MGSDVDLTRAMNAIAATLNEHKLESFDAERVQEITTGALGGEQTLVAYGSGTSGELRDGAIDGPAVARITLAEREWTCERIPDAHTSEALEQFEQERSQETVTTYQHAVRGRIAIWKKRFSRS
jgi:hypothetical protein